MRPSQVKGKRSAWTLKICAHYKRLRKPLRIEGLWKWRSVALSLHEAGVPVQSGAVSVERYWASLKMLLPQGSCNISPRWFRVLAMLCYVTYKVSHFSSGSLPPWCRSDSILAQRVEALAMCCKALQDQSTDDVHHLRPLFDPFLPTSGCQSLPAEQRHGVGELARAD